jgi:hypothetical protein
MPLSLADLLSIPSVDDLLNGEVLPAMRARGLNVTAWSDLDPWRILSYAVATLRQSVRQAIATRTAAGFGEYVFGFAQVPGGIDVTSWAGLRATSWYGVKPIKATYTKRRILLTNASASTYGPLRQGRMILKFSSGAGRGTRYIQDDDNVTIPALGSVAVIFRSEFPYDSASGLTYNNDASDPNIVMVNANFPGVTASNVPGYYTDVGQVGPGLGTLTLTGTPGAAHSVAVRIESPGQSGVATWSTSLDGGAWASQGAAASVSDLGGTGINIALTNDGGGSSPSFFTGTYYRFATPGTDVTQQGRDAETPQQLGQRSYAIWPSLGFAKDGATGNWLPFVPTASAIEALTRSVSDEIVTVLVRTDASVNNAVHVIIAAQGAPVSSGTLALLQLFWQTMAGQIDRYVVASPSTTAVVLAGATVKARASQLGQAQAAAQAAVAAYLSGADPNNRLLISDGSTIVDRSYLNSLIRRSIGVTHLDDGLTINGSAADLVLPVDNLATYAGNVASSLTWVAS